MTPYFREVILVLISAVLTRCVAVDQLVPDISNDFDHCNDEGNCVRKCCEFGFVFFVLTGTCTKNNSSASFLVPIYENETLVGTVGKTAKFRTDRANCNLFQLNPSQGEVFFPQRNGTLWIPRFNMVYTNDLYCVDENSAAFVCILDSDQSDHSEPGYKEKLRKSNATGMIISMPFLLITFIVYLLLPERNIHRRALMSYVFTLLAAYITLVTIQLYTGQFPDVACHILGHLIIFFFLVSFFWMNVMCIDMWLAFSGMRAFLSKREAERKRFIFYCIYAWGVPIIHTLTVFLLNTYGDPKSGYYPEIGKRRCFLGEELPTFYYFYLPMAILIGINIVLFILTTVRIQRIKKETSVLKHSDSNRSYEDDKQKFKLYLKLMFAMGVNWIMELVSWAVEWKIKNTPTFIWYLTDFTNAMYGLLIFLIFVFKMKIWKALKKRYYVCIGKPHLAHTMTSSARGTRTSNYSTTDTTAVHSDYRLNDLRNGKSEETALNRA